MPPGRDYNGLVKSGAALSHFSPRAHLLGLAVALLAMVPIACGGGSGTSTPTPTGSSDVATPSPAGAKPSPGLKIPTPGGDAAVPTSAPSGVFLVADAEAAALKELNAIYTTVLTVDGCLVNNPGRKLSILLESQPADAFGGVLLFGSTSPSGGGAALFFGRMPDGTWHYWFGTQNTPYQLTTFPADGFVCARGAGLNVREQPSTSASVITLLKDLSPIRAEEFVLTQPGSYGHAGPDPDGWYRISQPVEGWVNYRYISAASFQTCEFHDAVQPAP